MAREIAITSKELDTWRRRLLGEQPWSGRVSNLLLLDLLICSKVHGIDPGLIICEIRHLETPESESSHTKPAAPFTRGQLLGLWHKHFFDGMFMSQNFHNDFGWIFRRLAEQIVGPSGSPPPSDRQVGDLAQRASAEPFETRWREKRLTGGWIIYLPVRQENYYLCLGEHGRDQFTYERIMAHCVRDFPDLPTWIEGARKASG